MMLTMTNKGRFLKHCFCKCINLSARILRHATCNHFQDWPMWSQLPKEEYSIPEDVPRGHLAVYVGEDCKRYVIEVTLLKHPLFKALLDSAEDVFGFTRGSKLCIPCNESIFTSILRSANSQQDHRFTFCI